MADTQKMVIASGQSRVPVLDASSHQQVVIQSEHHEIHNGGAYKMSARSTNISTTPAHISFTTPNTSSRLHLVPDVYAVDAAVFTITEGPTGGVTGGSAATPINRRRDSLQTSAIINPLSGASAPTGGTVIEVDDLGSSSFLPGGVPGNTREAAEWVLKPNTPYSFRLTGASGVGNITLRWYEHGDRN